MSVERFKLLLSKLGNGMITDTQKREDLYFDKEFLDVALRKANEWLNELDKENKQLRELLEEGLEVSQVEIDEELDRMNKNE